MKKSNVCALILIVLQLSGCSLWPDKGRGGMAELHQDLLYPVMPDQPLGPEHGLRFELALSQRHLDVLILEGAELCFPATVIQAKQRLIRISRELHGGLEYDAANDLIIQRALLARLERQLDYVKQEDICVLPSNDGMKTPGEIGERIHELLNTDNQFAFDSSELNPKYIARLAEAVQLLKDKSQYKLRITGHADAVGEQEHNLSLSMGRAQKVGRYLQIMGLPEDRLEYHAVGSDAPLFTEDGDQPQTRLVNRRVSIELIESPSAKKGTEELPR